MKGQIGLDAFNGLIAAVQTAFGSFMAVYLGSHDWTQTQIGFALSISTIVVLLTQLPAGAMVDAMRDKRMAARAALLAITAALLIMALWPARLPVYFAMVLHGAASSLIGPAIAAISLALVGRVMLGERLGRNARYASIGAGATAAVIGLAGKFFPEQPVLVGVAALAVPAWFALRTVAVGPSHDAPPTPAASSGRDEIKLLLRDPRLTVFALCIGAYHLANAAMMPLAAAGLSRNDNPNAELIVATAIIMPQIVVALCAPGVGRYAERHGRRGLMLLGWGSLPVQALLLAVLPTPWLLPGVQFLGGFGAAVLGVMLPLVAADLSRGTRRFTLCLSGLSFPIAVGATLSTTLAGLVADHLGTMAAFLGLGLVGCLGTALLWLAMPETRPPPEDLLDGPMVAARSR